MSTTSDWAVDLGYNIEGINYHGEPGVLSVNITEDDPDGPGVVILSPADGSEYGRIQVGESRISSVNYYEEVGLLFASTAEDYVAAIDPETATLEWETQASSVQKVTSDRAILTTGNMILSFNPEKGTRQWRTTLSWFWTNTDCNADEQDISIRFTFRDDEGNHLGIVSVDAATGNEEWRYPSRAAGAVLSEYGIYVMVEDEDQTKLARLDERTGKEKWTVEAKAETETDFPFIIYPRRDTLYQRNTDGVVVAVDSTMGTRRWITDERSYCHDIWFKNDDMYACFGDQFEYSFVQLDRTSGRETWQVSVDGEVKAVSQSGDEILVGTGPNRYLEGGGSVYRLNATTGHVHWQFTPGKTIRWIDAGAETVLVGTYESVYGIEKDTGNARWSLADDSPDIINSTAEQVAIRGDEKLFMLDRDSGTANVTLNIERLKSEFGILSRSITTGGGVLYTVEDGTLTAYPLETEPKALTARTPPGDTQIYGSDNTTDTQVFESGAGEQASGDSVGSGSNSTPKFCPECGGSLSEHENARFCPECGREL